MARHMALFGFALFLVSEAGVPGQLTLKQQRTLTDARAVIESIRRLGAHDALGVSADCLSACPAVENIGKSLNKEMEAVQLKHAGAMMASMGNQPQDGNMDAQAMADLFKAMEPMYADIMAVTINNMCDNKDGYACLVQNADKCSDSGGMNQGSMGMGMDPLTASKDMGAQLECMCTVCPATKDKYIKMMSTIMIETMSALTTGLASMGEALASGTATEEQLTEETMANVDTKELEQKMMLAVCPLVGMKPCFEANPTECKGMIDQGFSKVEARRRLNSSAAPSLSHEFATLEADCKKAGVSTAPPATNEKVTTVVTLQGLDYDKVMADAAVKDGIIATVKSKFLANMPGYKESDLTVTLSKGSVKATVEIVPIPGANGASLKAAVEQSKENVAAAIIADVKNMANVDAVLESGTTKDQIQASASSPTASGGAGGDTTASGAHLVGVSMISVWLFASAAGSAY